MTINKSVIIASYKCEECDFKSELFKNNIIIDISNGKITNGGYEVMEHINKLGHVGKFINGNESYCYENGTFKRVN